MPCFTDFLRGCPRENHAKPCRRCYRLDHRIGLYSVSKYTWVHYFQIQYAWGPSSFPLCIRGGGGSSRETIFTVIEGRNFLKFRCPDHQTLKPPNLLGQFNFWTFYFFFKVCRNHFFKKHIIYTLQF